MNIFTGLSRAYRPYSWLAPSPFKVFKPRIARTLLTVVPAISTSIRLFKGEPLENVLGDTLAGVVTKPISKKLSFHKGLMMAQVSSRRTLLDPVIQEIERREDGRIIRRMRVMFHDANKAKKHLDVHIGRTSLIYRITGKPIEHKLKYNRDGLLTQESKDLLLDHLRFEVGNHSRVAQNLDHTITNALCSWKVGEAGLGDTGYGSGLTRQMVGECDVEFYHHRVRTSEHVYAPLISGVQGTYLYQIYPGTDTGVPILIWGKLHPLPLKFKDRLHLKLIQPEELETKFKGGIDVQTNTRKYDGASTHFHSDTGQGFKFFSPRISKETGKNVEYTFKVPELAERGSSAKPVGMGEMLFWRRTKLGSLLHAVSRARGPERMCWNYLPASEVGGVLNAHSIRATDIFPEVRIYRIDKWEGADIYNLPFWQNHFLQILLKHSIPSDYWKVVALAKPVVNRTTKHWEGFVGVPEGLSVNDGLKVKWWANANDWTIIANNLSLSSKGNIQGILTFKSLESGKEFNMGPGQIGSFDKNMELLEAGDDCIGLVAKVHGRNGHEGRAAKVVDWHLDK